MTALTPDLCVIGAGSGGLAVAAGAAQMGASVVLIERGKMGGDCLNYRLRAVEIADRGGQARAQPWRGGAAFGIALRRPRIDFAAVARQCRAR